MEFEIQKPVKVISGGVPGRMLFGKLMLQKPNILLMDEPTNHLDMESIESLNTALEGYSGTLISVTLISVSHDREFISSLATRIIKLTRWGVVNFRGNYENYLQSKAAAAQGASPHVVRWATAVARFTTALTQDQLLPAWCMADLSFSDRPSLAVSSRFSVGSPMGIFRYLDVWP